MAEIENGTVDSTLLKDDVPDPIFPDVAEETLGLEADGIIPMRGYHLLPIVGIGGSAGSIPAMQSFFASTAAATGMAYVIILHLSPEHESTLASVLQHSTKMPVLQVNQRTKVEANTVYVIPPGKQLSMTDGYLTLTDLDRTPGRRVAVDLFFRTLADTHGPGSRAIVLSGGDSDGAIGIKRIKERGGLTIVQDPEEAQFDGMPRASIATNMVDWVLPVSEMPARLQTYQENEERIRLPSVKEAAKPDEDDKVELAGEMALQDVLAFLRTNSGRDFTYYKRATILRRIARRMQVNGVIDLPSYLDFLHSHPGEVGALLQDLLISVTNFFRDGGAYQALEGNISRLFEGKGASGQVRVWVAGCATGEEAYSIAILLNEYAAKLAAPPRIQVFATDLDENAIHSAREGVYPETIVADVSEERLRNFFVKEQHSYRVKRSLRETVLFAVHDLLKDFPFSRLDLISCRNLLIYLNRTAQTRVFEIFHHALHPNGRLFLGSSETVDESNGLFFPLEKMHRLYGRHPTPRSLLPFSDFGGPQKVLGLSQRDLELSPPVSGPMVKPGPDTGLGNSAPPPVNRGPSWTELHFKLIEPIVPPSVIVDQNHEIVHLSKNAGRFLQFGGGEPSTNLLRVVNPVLRLDLRAALFRAAQTSQTVELGGLTVDLDGRPATVEISVRSASESAPGFLLVVFNERPDLAPGAEPFPPNEAMTHLEEELEQVKTQLRDTVDQYEVGSEELKASNEELQAINEELRSATEELETSREELQSINEELTTVNHELKGKVDEVSRTNSDLKNLMSSTNIATIFLDRELQIMRYTPPSVELFSLIPTDIGRPLSDLKPSFDYPALSADARDVLENLSRVEREIQSKDRWFLARLLPYRTPEDHIAGVVLTFVDITHRKEIEEALRASQKNLMEELKVKKDLHEMTMRLLNTSDLAATLEEVLNAATNLHETGSGSVHLYDPVTRRLTLAASTGVAPEFARQYETIDLDRDSIFSRTFKSGRRSIIEDLPASGLEEDSAAGPLAFQAVQITPLATRKGEVLGLMSAFFRQPYRPSERDVQGTDLYARQAADLIERKRGDEALRESEERIRAIVSQTTAGIGQIDLTGRLTFANRKLCALLGFSENELIGKNVSELTGSDEFAKYEKLIDHLRTDGRPFEVEDRYVRRDGVILWVSVSVAIARDAEGKPESAVVSVTDITERLKADNALKEALEENKKARAEIEAAAMAKDHFLAVLSHELRTPLTPILVTVGTLVRRPDLPARLREGLEMIRRNVQIESHFIDDLLDVTRITRNKFEIVRKETDVHEAVRHAMEISEADIQAKNQRLIVSLEARDHTLNGDPTRIQQIIWNLLKNSSKFSPDGAEIRITSRNENGCILVVVADPGIGIEPEVLPYIFNSFTQGGDSVSRQFGGLGLGLAISKAIIDAHEGSLSAESLGRGRGAVFTVSLPLHQK